jgi:hypothetical protein
MSSSLMSRRPPSKFGEVRGFLAQCRASHPFSWRRGGKVCIVFRVAPLDAGAEILGLRGRFVPVVLHVLGGCLACYGLSGGGFMDLLFDGWFGKLAKLPWH